MNTKVIAEFIEDKEIFNIVKILWVDYSQWFYFHKLTPQELI